MFGAGKLVWGSDMPNVERFCTYKQCLDYVRRYCIFLSAAEKDRILGDNVAALFGLMRPVREPLKKSSMTILPPASSSARAPGGTTQVASYSSTMRGPVFASR